MINHVESTMRVRYFMGDNDSKIINRLADSIEGLCGPDGMILPGSAEIVSRTPPFLTNIENGGVLYTIVKYRAQSLTLPEGTIIDAKIIEVENHQGAIALYSIDGHSVASIMLPTVLQDPKFKDLLRLNHLVRVKILMAEFGNGWKMINAVGQIIGETTKNVETTVGEW